MAYTRLKAVPKPSSSKSYSGAKVYDKEEDKADVRAGKRIGGDSASKLSGTYKEKQAKGRAIYKQEEAKAAKSSKKVESKANKQLKTGKKSYT